MNESAISIKHNVVRYQSLHFYVRLWVVFWLSSLFLTCLRSEHLCSHETRLLGKEVNVKEACAL